LFSLSQNISPSALHHAQIKGLEKTRPQKGTVRFHGKLQLEDFHATRHRERSRGFHQKVNGFSRRVSVKVADAHHIVEQKVMLVGIPGHKPGAQIVKPVVFLGNLMLCKLIVHHIPVGIIK